MGGKPVVRLFLAMISANNKSLKSVQREHASCHIRGQNTTKPSQAKPSQASACAIRYNEEVSSFVWVFIGLFSADTTAPVIPRVDLHFSWSQTVMGQSTHPGYVICKSIPIGICIAFASVMGSHSQLITFGSKTGLNDRFQCHLSIFLLSNKGNLYASIQN